MLAALRKSPLYRRAAELDSALAVSWEIPSHWHRDWEEASLSLNEQLRAQLSPTSGRNLMLFGSI